MTSPANPEIALCLCGHERRHHALSRLNLRLDCRHPARARRWFGRRRCPCVRYTEAPFVLQQIPLFEAAAS